MKSILAGILIGIGVIVNLSCTNGFIGALLFSLGLVLVLVFNADLFTGKIGYIIDEPNKKNILDLAKMLCGNIIGAFIVAVIIMIGSPDVDLLMQFIFEMPTERYFIFAIPCGALMYLAVEGYKRTKNFLIPIMCVTTFIVSGFQHCIVVAFYFGIFNLKFWFAVLGNTIGAIAMRWLTKEQGD